MPRVVFISTDGMRPDALARADTPILQSLMLQGSYSLAACSVMPSISLPCHMSIFHSVPPQRHGTLVNTYTPMARPVPGLIDIATEAGKRCATFISWEPLRDVSRPGRLSMSTLTAYRRNPDEADHLTVSAALPHLESGEFDFVFIYLATVDEVGHDFGWMSDRYLRQVEQTDTLLGRIMDSLPADTAVVIHSDHGGHDRTHGTDSAEDMTVPWISVGPGIRKNHEIEGRVSILDTAPTIASLLNVDPSPLWEGKVLEDIFAK